MAGLVSVVAVMFDPVVGLPVVPPTLMHPATFHPHVLVTTVGPVSRCPDVAMTGRGDFNDSRRRRGDLDLDSRVGQRDGSQRGEQGEGKRPFEGRVRRARRGLIAVQGFKSSIFSDLTRCR
jgi:hypothetical protein